MSRYSIDIDWVCHSPVGGDGDGGQGGDQRRGEGWTCCSKRCGELIVIKGLWVGRVDGLKCGLCMG